MAMQAATVEILIEKAKFEPRVAVAVAEAMDEAIDRHERRSQLVTVPILDARVAELRGELHGIRSDLQGEVRALRGELLGTRDSLCGEMLGIRDSLGAEVIGVRNSLRAEMLGMKEGLQGEMRGMKEALQGQMLGIKGEITRQMSFAVLGQLAVLLGAMYFFVTQMRS
jgi:hypothetical protein